MMCIGDIIASRCRREGALVKRLGEEVRDVVEGRHPLDIDDLFINAVALHRRRGWHAERDHDAGGTLSAWSTLASRTESCLAELCWGACPAAALPTGSGSDADSGSMYELTSGLPRRAPMPGKDSYSSTNITCGVTSILPNALTPTMEALLSSDRPR